VELADSKASRKARLSQYRKHHGRWQFFAVARLRDGKPNPEQVIVDGEPMSWQSPGAKFYLDWIDAETGKRIREIAGVTPRDAAGWLFRKASKNAPRKTYEMNGRIPSIRPFKRV
jgi:hypothetical protein